MLGDIVGPAADGLRMSRRARARLAAATGHDGRRPRPPAGVTIGDGIVVLDRVHRFGGGIAASPRRSAAATPTRRSTSCAARAGGRRPGSRRRRRPGGRRRSRRSATARSPPRGAIVDGRARRRRRRRARGARRLPAAVRPPPRPARRRGWTARIEGWLAEDSTASAPRPLVRRPPAAGDRERLRAAPLQRRHRRRRRDRAPDRVGAAFERARRDRRVQPRAAWRPSTPSTR